MLLKEMQKALEKMGNFMAFVFYLLKSLGFLVWPGIAAFIISSHGRISALLRYLQENEEAEEGRQEARLFIR